MSNQPASPLTAELQLTDCSPVLRTQAYLYFTEFENTTRHITSLHVVLGFTQVMDHRHVSTKETKKLAVLFNPLSRFPTLYINNDTTIEQLKTVFIQHPSSGYPRHVLFEFTELQKYLSNYSTVYLSWIFLIGLTILSQLHIVLKVFKQTLETSIQFYIFFRIMLRFRRIKKTTCTSR